MMASGRRSREKAVMKIKGRFGRINFRLRYNADKSFSGPEKRDLETMHF